MVDDIKVAIIAAVTAVVTTLLTIWAQAGSALFQAFLDRQKRRAEQLRAMERYSAPLLHASYDLQSRIYNIVVNDFLKNLNSPDPDTSNYSLQNTEYLIAQYFGWWEMIRCETQFIELGNWKKTTHLSKSLDEVTILWRNAFHLNPGEQRAIGERMVCNAARGREILGYADFLDALAKGVIPYSTRLEKEIKDLPNRKTKDDLVALHAALINILNLLDPKFRRFPAERRKKI